MVSIAQICPAVVGGGVGVSGGTRNALNFGGCKKNCEDVTFAMIGSDRDRAYSSISEVSELDAPKIACIVETGIASSEDGSSNGDGRTKNREETKVEGGGDGDRSCDSGCLDREACRVALLGDLSMAGLIAVVEGIGLPRGCDGVRNNVECRGAVEV